MGAVIGLAALDAVETARRRRAALSIGSRVLNGRGGFAGHLALMNLHPDGFLNRRELEGAILRGGFCCLRLTPVPPHKPKVPRVVSVLPG